MAVDGLAELGRQLGSPPPTALADVAPEDLRDLAAALTAARRRQAEELAAAGEQALKLIPRVLRGPMRRLMR
jgi:hypothetical protein